MTDDPPEPGPAATPRGHPPRPRVGPPALRLWLSATIVLAGLVIISAVAELTRGFRQGRVPEAALVFQSALYVLLGTALVYTFSRLRREIERADAAQSRAAESEERFILLADSAPVMIWQTDDHGANVYANRRLLEYRGTTPAEERGDGWRRGLHPDDRPSYTAAIMKKMAARQPFSLPVRLLSADGRSRMFLSVGTPRYDGAGRYQGYVGVLTDIEDLRRAEIEKERVELRLRALMEHSPSVVFIKGVDGRYEFVNRRFEDAMGKPAEQIRGRSDHELFPPESAELFCEQDRAVLRSGVPARYEHTVRYPDAARTYLTIKFPLKDASGQAYGLAGITTDITERKLVQLELENQMTRLAASLQREQTLMRELDHRVRNNIAGLLGLVALYEHAGRDGASIARDLRGKLVAMSDVHDLLGRQSGGPVPLGDLARRVVQGAVTLAPAQHVSFDGPPVALPAAQAHAMAMVLHELVVNSAKHGALRAPDGRIHAVWDIAPDRTLRLRWDESGPPAAPAEPGPRSGGVGLPLIRGLCASELRGSFDHRITDGNLHAVITAAVPAHLLGAPEPTCPVPPEVPL